MLTFSSTQTNIASATQQERTWLFEVGSYKWSTKEFIYNSNTYTATVVSNEWGGITETANRGDIGHIAPSDIKIPIVNPGKTLDEDDFKSGDVFNTVNVKLLLSATVNDIFETAVFREWIYVIDKVDDVEQKLYLNCKDYLTSLLDGVWPNTKQVAAIIPAENYSDYDNVCIPKVFGTAYIPIGIIYDPTTTSTCPYGQWYHCLGLTDTTYLISEFRTPRDAPLSIWPDVSDTLTATDYAPQENFIVDGTEYRVFQAYVAEDSYCGGPYGEPSSLMENYIVKFSRADTVGMTSPASVVNSFLSDIGASASLMSGTSFDVMAATYSTWGIEYNYGFYMPEEREDVLTRLLNCCNSTLKQRSGQICLDKFDRTNRATFTDNDILRSADGGPTTFKHLSGSTVEDSDAGYTAFKKPGQPQDELAKTIVIADGGASYEYLTDDTLANPYVQNSIYVRRAAELWLQRKYWMDKRYSFNTTLENLYLEVDDVITLSGSEYGGAKTVVIDSIKFPNTGVPQFTVSAMKTALENWGDSVPASTSIDALTESTATWQPVFAGPDQVSGSNVMPNKLYGRLRIQDTETSTNTIIIDPSDPTISVLEDGTERVIMGQVASGEYGIKGNDAAGTEIFKIDTSGAHISGWSITENILQVESGKVGINSEISGGLDWRFWAGNTTRASAPFRVDENGRLFATTATIAGTITATAGAIGGWSITADTLETSNSTGTIKLDTGETEVSVIAGSNYVKIRPDGLIGYDAILGETLRLFTDGTAPRFASGVIDLYDYHVYSASVIKTSADPPTDGGLAINNYGIQGWTSNGTLTARMTVNGDNAGDFYAGDYSNGNPGISYDHSDGELNFRGTLTVDSVPNLPTDEDLVGHWPLNDGIQGSSKILDYSHYENHGTGIGLDTSADWTQGIAGTCPDFHRTGEYVYTGTNSSLDGIKTFSCWVNPTSTVSHSTYYHHILTKHDTYQNGLGIDYKTKNNRFYMASQSSTAAASTSIAIWAFPTSNTWYHIVGMFSNSQSRLYVNSVLKDTDSAISNNDGYDNEIADAPVRIGGGVANRYSEVQVAQCRVYTRCLTLEEIKALYLNPSGVSPGADDTKRRLETGTRITSGYIEMSSGGDIHSYGKSTYASNTKGFFVGYDDTESDYVINVGDDSNYIKWDGAELNIAGTLSVGTVPKLPSDENLVAYWPMDEYAGDLNVYDRSGNVCHGTVIASHGLHSRSFTDGPVGPSIYLQSTYVNCGTISTLDLTGDISISTWIKIEDSPFPNPASDNWHIISRETLDTNGYCFRVNDDGYVEFRTNQAGDRDSNAGETLLVSNTWYHVGVTLDSTRARIFVNGALDGSYNGVDYATSSTDTLYIGTSRTIGQGLRGKISQLRIYNKTLTENEMMALYTNPKGHGYPSEEPAALPTDEDLLIYYKLDEVNTTQCFDSSPNGIHAIIRGTDPSSASKWSQGMHGNAFELDGSTDYIRVPNDSALSALMADGSTGQTVVMWAKANTVGVPSNYEYFFSRYEGAEDRTYHMWHHTEGYFRTLHESSNTNAVENHTGFDGVEFYDGEWHQIAFVIARTDGYLRFYMDGELKSDDYEGSNLWDQPDDASLDSEIYIGRDMNSAVGYFDGKMDDIRIYSKALTTSQIKALYNSPPSITPDQFKYAYLLPSDEYLVQHLTFDDPAGSTIIKDASRHRNDATIGGTTPIASDFESGIMGQALHLNGTDHYVLAASSSSTACIGSDSFSLSMWVKPDTTDESTLTSSINFFSKQQDDSSTEDRLEFRYEYNNERFVMFIEHNNNGSDGYHYFQADEELRMWDGNWHHLAMVADYTNGLRLYLDGVANSRITTFTGSNSSQNNGAIEWGNRHISSGYEFDGCITDCRVYSTALTHDEVLALYNYRRDRVKEMYGAVDEIEDGVTITDGGIVMSAGGALRSTAKTEIGSNSEAGVFYGYDSGQYGLSISDGTTGATLSYLNFGTTDGFSMKLGKGKTMDIDGTINMGVGADINMESTAGDRAIIAFAVSNSRDIRIAADFNAETFAIYPSEGSNTSFRIGYNHEGNTQKFEDIYIEAKDYFAIGVFDTSGRSTLYMDSCNVSDRASTILTSTYNDSPLNYSDLDLQSGETYSECHSKLYCGFDSTYGQISLEYTGANTTKLDIVADNIDFNSAAFQGVINLPYTGALSYVALRIIKITIAQGTGATLDVTLEDRQNAHASLHTTLINDLGKGSANSNTYAYLTTGGSGLYIKPGALGDDAYMGLSIHGRGNYGNTAGIDLKLRAEDGRLIIAAFEGDDGTYDDMTGFTGTVYADLIYLGT